MNMLAPLISRNPSRFGSIAGKTVFVPPVRRCAPSERSRRSAMPPAQTAEAPLNRSDLKQFLSAFAGGLVFFSILIA